MEKRKDKLIFISFGIIFGFAFTALILILMAPPKPEKIIILPTYTQSLLVVYITGEVQDPGLYELSPGQRISDAIELAGGPTQLACLDQINLASKVMDGQKIAIPSVSSAVNIDLPSAESNTTRYNLININLCDKEELISLPGIGEGKAQAVIDYRNQNGAFETIEDIMLVPGIGESIFESIKEYISIQ